MPRVSKLILKIAIAVGVIALLGVLFVRSIQTTRAEPYRVERAVLQDWRVVTDAEAESGRPVLMLQAPDALGRSLFRQVFTRSMESMVSPPVSAIPLLLREELTALGEPSLEQLASTVREAGLDTRLLEPQCLAHLRISEPGYLRQAHLLVFATEPFLSVREAFRRRAGEGTRFDPAALAPVLFVTGSDAAFHRWLPVHDPASRCVAPVEVV